MYICTDLVTTTYIVFTNGTVGLRNRNNINSKWRILGRKIAVKGILLVSL